MRYLIGTGNDETAGYRKRANKIEKIAKSGAAKFAAESRTQCNRKKN
jgi:hypothetical protein